MNQTGLRLYNRLRGSILHPQWMTDRFLARSRHSLRELHDCMIVDIGSGNSRSVEDLHSSNVVVRLDYPATNQRYQILPDVFGDARQLPIARESLDAILLFEVLEHLDSPDRTIKEIHRALRAGGRLYCSVPFLYPIHDAPNDFYRFTVHGFRHILQNNGFEVIRVAQHGNSLQVPLQLLNLAVLEGCRAVWRKHTLLGLFAAAIGYPICLLDNLVSLPLTLLPDAGAGCFGYFIVARRL